MKNFLIYILSIVVLSMIISSFSNSKNEKKPAVQKFVDITTGNTQGTYFSLGTALADILNKNIVGLTASAKVSDGSVDNINLLKQGKANLAFVQSDIVYYAVNGLEMFKDKKVDGLEGLAVLYPEIVQIITLQKSNIRSINDFRGKRIAVGNAGSANEANARQIMEVYGITYNDIQVQHMLFIEALDNLKNGGTDVVFITSGQPIPVVQRFAEQNEVFIIPMDEKQTEDLIKKYPFYNKTMLPQGIYTKQNTDIKAVAVQCMLVSTDKLDENTAYDIMKVLYTNINNLQNVNPVAGAITKANGRDGMPIKLNIGAERFFQEK